VTPLPRPTPKPPFQLTRNGKPLDLSTPTPAQDRLLKFLASLPDGETMKKEDVIAKLGIGRCILLDAASRSPKLSPYRYLVSTRAGYLFGNARTVREIERQVKAMRGES
jgi:hypothetical protein